MEIIFNIISVITYGLLGLLAVWGAYCVILVWRRVAQTRFRDELDQDEFLEELESNIQSGNFDNALELTNNDRRALPQLVTYAIENRDAGYHQLRREVGERFQQDVMADIEHRLSWIATVTKAAPMVGLMGTVIGMMGAFAKIGAGEKVDASIMAKDISFALITTACGLAIAVPLVLITAGINIRIRKMEDLVDLGLGRIFELLTQLFSGPKES
ncbi:MAG: MotA/TolQ/ExbB proton channel family protein [Pirellulales bacterium]|nr:MotA/TolQ/ExbB proton channel family protein [Pirellulales bacterium]